ncbi:PaaI family thioesterase [Enterovirga rhinocerotis]|uniref:Uncharacterized protein (TIGR00369 family) n=1 Tax=Enterovirga rhinocerotis TaxID=1339210 RepID=A0A4R7C250_9HYPH|nr:PaaI family thioesterase [Enterovirga rhinocerotis]TDR90496.1 uncharacterized protein (TIGR00369 family) [Enterovirga rhinocerotis]
MTIFGATIPFADHCGIEEIGVVDGTTRLRVRPQPHHLNNIGIAHGGLVATLLDIAMGTACRTQIGCPVMTLDMQIAFLAPGRGTLIGIGRVVRAGRSILFVESEVRCEEDDALVAKGSGLFKPARRAGPADASEPVTGLPPSS